MDLNANSISGWSEFFWLIKDIHISTKKRHRDQNMAC